MSIAPTVVWQRKRVLSLWRRDVYATARGRVSCASSYGDRSQSSSANSLTDLAITLSIHKPGDSQAVEVVGFSNDVAVQSDLHFNMCR
jgi:hypothetical protein